MHRMHEATPGPVYGMPRISSSSCGVPSSPPGPCRAMKATSGRSSLSERTRSASASRGTTSWPSEARASSTRAPERSDTCRSSELPPFSTATFMTSTAATGGAAARQPAEPRASGDPVAPDAERRRRRNCVLGGDRLVQPDLLADDGADPPDALADLVVVGPGEVQPHGVAAPLPVDIRRSAGHEGHVLAQRLRQQVGGVDVVRERRPDEEPAARPGPRRLGREVALERLEHRVATGAVDVAEAVDVSPPAILREVLEREVLGERRGAEVGRLLAERRSSPSPGGARPPSRGGCRGRGSSRTFRRRSRSRRRRAGTAAAAGRPRSAADRTGCPRPRGPRGCGRARPAAAGAPARASRPPGSGSSAPSR